MTIAIIVDRRTKQPLPILGSNWAQQGQSMLGKRLLQKAEPGLVPSVRRQPTLLAVSSPFSSTIGRLEHHCRLCNQIDPR
jgi:hypothetical protein